MAASIGPHADSVSAQPPTGPHASLVSKTKTRARAARPLGPLVDHHSESRMFSFLPLKHQARFQGPLKLCTTGTPHLSLVGMAERVMPRAPPPDSESAPELSLPMGYLKRVRCDT